MIICIAIYFMPLDLSMFISIFIIKYVFIAYHKHVLNKKVELKIEIKTP